MINLRPYQTRAIQELRESFKTHKRILLVLPTGAGKTICFSEMVRLAFNRGTQVLIATDRIELFAQTLKAISKHNIPTQIINAETKIFYPYAPVSICMCETLARRMKKWKNVNYNPALIICDESHKSSFFKILDSFPNAFCIGATATPINNKLHLYYTHIVNTAEVGELIEMGYLCRARCFQMQDDFSDVPIVRGEFEDKKLFQHFNTKKLYSGCVKKYQEKTPGKKALVFNCNIEHAVKMNQAFNEAGIHSEVVHSKTPPEERKRIFKAFEDGIFKVLNNCSIATTGLDIPSIEVIIMNRATASTILFLQCIGRGSRPTENKKEFIILDFGQNFTRHGLFDQPREWSLAPPKKKKKNGAAPVRSCPSCTAMLAASLSICSFCGYVFVKKTHEEKNGVLVEVKSNIPVGCENKKLSEMSIDNLIDLKKCKKLGSGHIWRIVRSRGETAIVEFADRCGYKTGWVQQQMSELDDCKFHDRVIS